jgi:hypothetical protein
MKPMEKGPAHQHEKSRLPRAWRLDARDESMRREQSEASHHDVLSTTPSGAIIDAN